MKIGRYDQEVTIYTKQRVSNGAGGYMVTYINPVTIFARVEQLKQSRSLQEVQLKLPTALRIGIHFDAYNPTLENVIEWQGEKYNIINTPTRVDYTRNVKEWEFDIVKANNV